MHQRALAATALLCGALALAGPGAVAAQAGRSLPGRAAAARGPSVPGALSGLERSGAITEAVYRQDYSAYTQAKRSLAKLSGTRRSELGAVLSNVQAIAAAGEFTPTRLGALFLTLERNRSWWTSEPLLSNGERVSFPPSHIVWEYYAGQGIEIQWLATFGEANGYYLAGNENANLRQLLGEVIPLATDRAGGIAWEYMFRFDGGLPPWTSGLSQGTALQVLARAYSRFKEAADLTAAQQALGIFETPPPVGVRVSTAAGAAYAEYTYAPGDQILNGFIQSLVGLYDYTSITKDPLGLQLFEAGDAQARAEVPRYDTGAWSLYDQFGESNLNYHELLTEFLQHLCERTRKGPPFKTPTAPAPAPSTTTSTSTTTPPAAGTSPAGGTSPAAATSPAAGASPAAGSALAVASAAGSGPDAYSAQSSPGSPIPGDQIYCTTAQHFTSYLRTPPVISLITTTLRGGTRAGVQVSLSKISTVRLTIRKGTRVVWTNSAYVGRGKPRLLWLTPAAGGTFNVTVSASDPAGNFATATGSIVVKHH
jgi:hypothetical protein